MTKEELKPEERSRISSLGGKARAKSLPGITRSLIAQKAALKRWSGKPSQNPQEAP